MNKKSIVLCWAIMLGSAIASTIFVNKTINIFGKVSYNDGIIRNASDVIDILHSLNNEEEKKNETV